ncbi:phytanoyl- dioxygenase family protein [Purpureocillium lavendulum]|uniref:Phytanoyl- dioxygenase family protein n=1 Tax=Purpureocillium lavendulum TaxID=1247861 RepID=A0AB34FSE4_9HYPO|nr:phytanoyl- dioxygenase family protein [Purpureocillium lavendulum]
MASTSHIPNGDPASTPPSKPDTARLYSTSQPPSLDAFKALCAQTATAEQYPLAASIERNIPIYDLPAWTSSSSSSSSSSPSSSSSVSAAAAHRAALQDEWYRVLLHGPGVFVARGLVPDETIVDAASAVFHSIITRERQGDSSAAAGDHFAGAGSNDRIWNSLGKHALADAPSFARYYANPWLALVADAWLGPGYRVTAQVNNVRPGAAPQVCHRDYHLGFMSAARCARVPRAAHAASQLLTLQGAVAHVDVPPESGPTRLLPFSQAFAEGYMAYRRPEFNAYFLDNYVALPLKKGDGLFFNPALFHAAGENTSRDIERMANLLQISSAFGKPMETIDARPMVESCWGELRRLHAEQGMSDEIMALVAVLGEGYPFPTNLDKNPPQSDDMAPLSEQDVILRCLEEKSSKEAVLAALDKHRLASQA